MPGVESRGKKIKSGALCTLEHEFLQRLVFPDLTQVIDKTLQLTFISEAKVAVFVRKKRRYGNWKLPLFSFMDSKANLFYYLFSEPR